MRANAATNSVTLQRVKFKLA